MSVLLSIIYLVEGLISIALGTYALLAFRAFRSATMRLSSIAFYLVAAGLLLMPVAPLLVGYSLQASGYFFLAMSHLKSVKQAYYLFIPLVAVKSIAFFFVFYAAVETMIFLFQERRATTLITTLALYLITASIYLQIFNLFYVPALAVQSMQLAGFLLLLSQFLGRYHA